MDHFFNNDLSPSDRKKIFSNLQDVNQQILIIKRIWEENGKIIPFLNYRDIKLEHVIIIQRDSSTNQNLLKKILKNIGGDFDETDRIRRDISFKEFCDFVDGYKIDHKVFLAIINGFDYFTRLQAIEYILRDNSDEDTEKFSTGDENKFILYLKEIYSPNKNMIDYSEKYKNSENIFGIENDGETIIVRYKIKKNSLKTWVNETDGIVKIIPYLDNPDDFIGIVWINPHPH